MLIRIPSETRVVWGRHNLLRRNLLWIPGLIPPQSTFFFHFKRKRGRRTDECKVPLVIYFDTWRLRLVVGCDGCDCDCDCGGGGGCCGCDCNEGMCIWGACGKKCSWAVMTDGSKPRWCPCCCCCCWCLPLSGELTNKWGSKSFVVTSPVKTGI